MKFEWDEEKRQSNIHKHGIDFVDAIGIFGGTTLTIEDDRFDYKEQRFATIGFLQGRVILVVHTEDAETIRIISARKATKHEQVQFFQNI